LTWDKMTRDKVTRGQSDRIQSDRGQSVRTPGHAQCRWHCTGFPNLQFVQPFSLAKVIQCSAVSVDGFLQFYPSSSLFSHHKLKGWRKLSCLIGLRLSLHAVHARHDCARFFDLVLSNSVSQHKDS
jgi:hypothetical protein